MLWLSPLQSAYRRCVHRLLQPVGNVSRCLLTLPLRAFLRFGEPLHRVVQFIERFPQFRL